MTLYVKFIYFLFVYLISNNKWILVESSDTSTDPNPVTEKEQTQSTATELDSSNYPQDIKLFKADPEGNKAEIKTTECYEDQYLGNLTYAFKPGVKCTLVKFGDKDVWKKGDEEVDEPKSVTYDSILGEVVVRDASNSVHFGKESETGEWKHVVTIPRTKMAMVDKRAETAAKSKSPGSGLSSSTSEPETGSVAGLRGTPVSGESSGVSEEPASSTSGGAAEGSGVATPAAPEGSSTPKARSRAGSTAGSRAGSTAGSRAGSTAGSDVANDSDLTAADPNESSAVPAEGATSGDGGSSASPDAGSTAGPGAGLTEGDGSGHVAGGSDADGTAGSPAEDAFSGQASTDAGLASGEAADAGSSGEAGEDKPGDSGSSGGTETADPGLASGEAAEAGSSTQEPEESTDPGLKGGDDSSSSALTSSEDQDSTAQTSIGEDADSGSVASPPTANEGSGTDTSSGEGTGTNEDYTETSGGDGSLATPLASSGGDSSTLGQDGSSVTPPASSGGDGASESSSSDLDIKFFANDSKDANKTVELDSTNYDKKDINAARIDYELKTEVKCTSITVDGVELWKHGDHNCQDYPTSVSYRYGDTIVIHLGNGFVQYIKSNNTWNVEFENNLKTSGGETPDPSSQDQNETKTSGGGGTGTDGSGGGGTGTGKDGTHEGANEGKGTSGEGGDDSSQHSSGSPTSGGTDLTSGQSMPTGGSGQTAGGQDSGTKTCAVDNSVQEKTNKSSSSKKKSSSGCFGFNCCGRGSSKSS